MHATRTLVNVTRSYIFFNEVLRLWKQGSLAVVILHNRLACGCHTHVAALVRSGFDRLRVTATQGNGRRLSALVSNMQSRSRYADLCFYADFM